MAKAQKAKIGAGVAKAYGRQGLAELRAVLTFEGSAAQPVDPGMWGVATQQEVNKNRGIEADAAAEPTSPEQNQEQASSPLAARQDALRAAATAAPAQPDRGHER